MCANETVILVDSRDRVIGTGDKIEVHRIGALHRAFSVLIFNSRSQLLLQKRAMTKYHSRGLWSNTCCGHPRPEEPTGQAARRRLLEEMGLDCPLQEMYSFTYRASLENGLTEHEFNHVFIGRSDQNPIPALSEADEWKWSDLSMLEKEIQEKPHEFSYWFRICMNSSELKSIARTSS
jgi:isopentenyl-diphosphate delta-isomerase